MYVYVMKNKAIPALVKVGFSDNPSARAQELKSTGLPGRWQVFARFSVVNKREAEAAAHRALTDYREDKEFFKLNPENAAERVAKAVEPWHVEHPRAPDDWSRWSDPAKWRCDREEQAARQQEEEEESARRQKEEQWAIADELRRREIEAEIKKQTVINHIGAFFIGWILSFIVLVMIFSGVIF